MQYILLIYEDERIWDTMGEAEQGKMFEEYGAFSAEVKAAGKFRAGEALLPTNKATTVRVRDGKTLLTDGPFAETREQLGGFYLIEADNLDDAVAIAAKIPNVRTGSVEVRPIMTFE